MDYFPARNHIAMPVFIRGKLFLEPIVKDDLKKPAGVCKYELSKG
jgi:hypothetical protein